MNQITYTQGHRHVHMDTHMYTYTQNVHHKPKVGKDKTSHKSISEAGPMPCEELDNK